MRQLYKKVQDQTVSVIDTTVVDTARKIDKALEPGRAGFARRYPTVFSLLVTFGVAATFLGFEQLLLSFGFLERYPFVIFMLGIGILVLTGTLYKKLQ